MTKKLPIGIQTFEKLIKGNYYKVVELTDTGKALEQIMAKGYADKLTGQEVYLIEVEFSSQERNIVGYEWEKRIGK